MEIKEAAYSKALEVLKSCATSHGFHAASPGYQGVWARDSVITSIGASLVDKKFKDTFKESLIVLARHQSRQGEIPNAVLYEGAKVTQVDYKSIDSTLWFIIGHYLYKSRYKDSELFNKHKKNLARAFTWLDYQSMSDNPLLNQLPTTDWQDAFPHRYGRTINSQALYYKALTLSGDKKKALLLKEIVNHDHDDCLWNGAFYLPWRWKNHNKYKEQGEWFDSLGNLLAIVFDLASNEQAEKILQHIRKEKIESPYPFKSIYPPILENSKDWQDYFDDCEARSPYHYLNAGIWTFIGGFYVLALVKMKKYHEAEKQLWLLAEANMQEPFFSEWLNGQTGKPGISGGGLAKNEGNQAWNAGMYVAAYESTKNRKVFL